MPQIPNQLVPWKQCMYEEKKVWVFPVIAFTEIVPQTVTNHLHARQTWVCYIQSFTSTRKSVHSVHFKTAILALGKVNQWMCSIPLSSSPSVASETVSMLAWLTWVKVHWQQLPVCMPLSASLLQATDCGVLEFVPACTVSRSSTLSHLRYKPPVMDVCLPVSLLDFLFLFL